MTFRPVPKPARSTDSEKRVDRLTKAWSRQSRWRAKAIAKAKGKPRTKVKARNENRIARKAKEYRRVIGSAFNRELRYKAYLRSGGLCECDECVEWRKRAAAGGEFRNEDADAIRAAITEIPCWFVAGGGAPMAPASHFLSEV